ncbi:hypothetical protein [Tenacibaculum agarivorans]|uniref:hypothetical protein n=1 Tax=Tenacibaculum agarivorans TaxID=1908389 RepID=UPI00094B97B6|nr:hypothetical protein [Tenacibaculum agarivorans]
MSIITLPNNVTPTTTPYKDLPQPAATVHDKLVPPYNITISKEGVANFSVAVTKGNPAPTTVQYIPNDPSQSGYNILKVTCTYQTNGPVDGDNVDVYTYTNISLGVTFPTGDTDIYPLSYAPAPNSESDTNEDPETSRGTVVIVRGGDGGQ